MKRKFCDKHLVHSLVFLYLNTSIYYYIVTDNSTCGRCDFYVYSDHELIIIIKICQDVNCLLFSIRRKTYKHNREVLTIFFLDYRLKEVIAFPHHTIV